jgi:large subunit ribosomal protein L35
MSKKIKHKTKKSFGKRVKISSKKKIIRKHSNRSHLAHNKSTKQKRHLRKDSVFNKSALKPLKYAL